MSTPPDTVPDDVETLKAAFLAERAARREAEAMVAHLKLLIAKLQRERFGPCSEHGRRHGDDTTVPVLAKGRTVTGRLWTYVRDDRPSADRTRRRPSTSTPATATAST